MRKTLFFFIFFLYLLISPIFTKAYALKCTAQYAPTSINTKSKVTVAIPYLEEGYKYTTRVFQSKFSSFSNYNESITPTVNGQEGKFEIDLAKTPIGTGEYYISVIREKLKIRTITDDPMGETCLETKINILPDSTSILECPVYIRTSPTLASTNMDVKLVFDAPPAKTFAIVLNTTPPLTFYLYPTSNSFSIGQFAKKSNVSFSIYPIDKETNKLGASCDSKTFDILDPSEIPTPTSTPTSVPPTPVPPPCGDTPVPGATPGPNGCESFSTAFGNIKTDPLEFIRRIYGILLGLSGGIIIVLIMYSGYQLMTSAGDKEKVQAARDRITSAIVGLLFLIFSMVILQVIGVDILNLPGFR